MTYEHASRIYVKLDKVYPINQNLNETFRDNAIFGKSEIESYDLTV